MEKFLVTKEVEFDYGHRIKLHSSKCRNLHGHRGKLVATWSGPLQLFGSSTGMVLDFGDLKEMLMVLHDSWDHVLILEKSDPLLTAIDAWQFPNMANVGLSKIFKFDGAPTAENLALYAYNELNKFTAQSYNEVKLESVVFYETPTSSATITRANMSTSTNI